MVFPKVLFLNLYMHNIFKFHTSIYVPSRTAKAPWSALSLPNPQVVEWDLYFPMKDLCGLVSETPQPAACLALTWPSQAADQSPNLLPPEGLGLLSPHHFCQHLQECPHSPTQLWSGGKEVTEICDPQILNLEICAIFPMSYQEALQ